MPNVIPDIPRIFTAFAEWSSCLIFIAALKPRLEKHKLIGASVAFFVLMSYFMEVTAYVWIWLWIPCMLVAYMMMGAFIYSCTRVTRQECLYYTTFAFCIAEMTAAVEWRMIHYFPREVQEGAIWLHVLCVVVVYGIIELGMWMLISKHMPPNGRPEIGNKDALTVVVIGIAAFTYSNLRFIDAEKLEYVEFIKSSASIRALADTIGVAMIYANFVANCENKIKKELEAVQKVLQNQYMQYKLSKESIELINYKYHDLKHQIAVLKKEIDSEKSNAILNKMEAEIKQYELQNKTGNDVLDTVLTSKGIYCDKHKITLTIVADGGLVDFMETMDICSIFGNALDNAIESVMKISDIPKRLIHLSVSKQKEFAMIRIENYFEEDLQYEEGQLATTKRNKELHGYGIKSIQYTVNKYGGAVAITTERNWFSLKILIPLNE